MSITHCQKWLYFFVTRRSSMRENSPQGPSYSRAGLTRVLVGRDGSSSQRVVVL
jgi:hypothetical protein